MKIYKAVYSVEDIFGRIRIFNPLFVIKNRYKYKIVYKNK